MKKFQRLTNTIRVLIVLQMLIALVAPVGVFAHVPQEIYPDVVTGDIQLPKLNELPGFGELVAVSQTEISAQAAISPTLEVDILGTPVVPYDFNDIISPDGFVVHAQVVNTGTVTAENVTLTLDFTDDQGTGWMLLSGEVEERSRAQLAPANTLNAYWFATYPLQVGATHQYTVTATADNFDPITAVGTAEVVNGIDTGNNYQERSGAEANVGVTFTISVTYNLGTNHNVASFNPAGNSDFEPGAYRLLSTVTDFFDSSQNPVDTFYDQLYFPNLKPEYATATTLYEFIALSPTNSRLCPFTMVSKENYKYDNDYCQEPQTLPITGTISVAMDKFASHETILQGETITYTINYTNNGALQLKYAWVWDDVDPGFASILPDTLVPAGDPTWTNDHRAAWYPDVIGAVDAEPPPRNGTVSFAAVVDGGGFDLADGDILVNHGKFGITENRLPETVALTATTYTTIQAPSLVLTKTDYQDSVEPGTSFTYTLQVENIGSEIAENLIVTDTLPAYLSLAGIPQPGGYSIVGDQIVWTGLGSLSFGDPPLELKIPVELDIKAPDGYVITNTMQVGYANRVGHVYNPAVGTDTTLVNGPSLTITKTDLQDPALVARELTYELAYSNEGQGVATGVVISDVIPADTIYEDKCSDSCGYNSTTDVITWTIGTISPGASDPVTFTVRVSELLESNDILTNDNYGIYADQLDFTLGDPVTTTVKLVAALIQGKAFIDENVNGLLDVGEAGIENVEVTLLDALVPVTQTSALGDYAFYVEVQKAISLTAGLPAGYFRTSPETVYLDASLGVTDTVVNFGYAPVTSTWGAAYATVYEDNNFNGTQDLGENGIPGVEVASTLAITSPLTTTDYGQVTFRYDISNTVTLTETDPAGYVSTTPNVVETYVEPGTGQPVSYGDYPGIMMSGMVFDDLDVDGVNNGEPGLPGAVVSSGTTSYTTSVSGTYTLFLSVDESPIEITEVDPAGYVSTNAIPGLGVTRSDNNTLLIEAPNAGTEYTGDFGDVQASDVITVSGTVWDDNGEGTGGGMANGLREIGEPGLAGAVIELSSGITATTATEGDFTLYAPAGTTITVTEQNPANYVSTASIPGPGAIAIDRDTLVISPLSPGDTSAGHLFGDVTITSTAIITGYVFDDANENGIKGAGENGLEGITVTLEISGVNTISILTDSTGAYQFAVAPGTNLKISSSGPGGDYYPTTLETVILHPTTAGNYGDNNFGYSDDVDTAVIMGIVFDDVNGNGVREYGELGLPGAVISLTLDDNLVYSYTTTGTGVITGTFTFSVPIPTEGETVTYGVHEANPAGYRSTTPDDLNVPLTSAQPSYIVEFGDTNSPVAASIFGTVYDDVNNNGKLDGAEPGIPGVTVKLYDPVLQSYVEVTTNQWGEYTFQVSASGTYVVSETDPDGYISTTPNEVHVNVTLGESYPVHFGDVLKGSADYATIYGTVFHDGNGNGLFDTDELGIEGVLITLDNLYTTTTDIYGAYTFSTTITGTHTVVETDLDGYFSTTPNEVHPTAEMGEAYQVDFGDAIRGVDEFASIHGTVFHDLDQNGIWDADEPGISGVTVTLDASVAIATDIYGSYIFSTTVTGTHTVAETDPDGYISTTPNEVHVDVTLGESYPVHFGDVLKGSADFATIYGTVFHDGNGNGTFDTDELGIEGVLITLDNLYTTTTDIYGAYTFSTTITGTHTVVETDLDGYFSTTPNEVHPTVELGEAEQVDFGDAISGVDEFASIHGTVFHDLDQNGVWDADEPGISGVTVTLDASVAMATDIYGSYTFSTTIIGTHTVVETDLPKHISTTPNTVELLGVVMGEDYQVDFGDVYQEFWLYLPLINK
jgi:uncharacterized repeat protein (TIGR01451 family)